MGRSGRGKIPLFASLHIGGKEEKDEKKMHQRYSVTASIPVASDDDGVSEQARENAFAVWAWLMACVGILLVALLFPANAHAAGQRDAKTTIEWARTHSTAAEFFRGMWKLHAHCVPRQPTALRVCMDTGRNVAKVASTR